MNAHGLPVERETKLKAQTKQGDMVLRVLMSGLLDKRQEINDSARWRKFAWFSLAFPGERRSNTLK
jgi:hypothetical protein